MITETFSPPDIERLIRIAGALADTPAAAVLAEGDRELAARARAAILARAAGRSAPATSTVLGPRPGQQVWLLRMWTKHGDSTLPYASKDAALAELAGHARSSWDNLYGEPGVPDQPPADDGEAVKLYYGPNGDARPSEGYSLHAEDIVRPQRSRILPLKFAFPTAAEADVLNRAAVFHASDDDGPGCMEVVGVLTFAYLDAKDGVVRISVHLDTADERIVRPDGTVPLRVVVEDTVILDDGPGRAPHPTVLEELLGVADADQEAAICMAAVAAGLMWCCPACRWTNPRAAVGCEGPGHCRTAKPSDASQQAAALSPGAVPELEGPR